MPKDPTPVIFEDTPLQVAVSYEEDEQEKAEENYNISEIPRRKMHLHKKWTSAFRVVQSMTRFKNMRHHSLQNNERSGFSSNESTPSRIVDNESEPDPVYLALKQATERYGSGGSSRRSSHQSAHGSMNGGGSQHLLDSATPSPRNLSQISLHDSGYSGGDYYGGVRLLGSTPQLANNMNVHNTTVPIGVRQALNNRTGARRPKLSEKMKSLSLDCADMPPPVQGMSYKSNNGKSMRPGMAVSGESLDLGRSMSPPLRHVRFPTPRRLPAIPGDGKTVKTDGTHVVIHEYLGNGPENSLFLGDRINIVDNGDPDWQHGFKANDRSEKLLTFPSTCVAIFHPGEQPMKLVQNCNIIENKLRLYRDQVVFAQKEQKHIHEGRIYVRNEHGTKLSKN